MHVQFYDAPRIFYGDINAREFEPPVRLNDIGWKGFGVTRTPPVDADRHPCNRHDTQHNCNRIFSYHRSTHPSPGNLGVPHRSINSDFPQAGGPEAAP
jgi:hypothetical protein